MSTINEIIKEALGAVGNIGIASNIDNTPSEKNTNKNYQHTPTPDTANKSIIGGATKGGPTIHKRARINDGPIGLRK